MHSKIYSGTLYKFLNLISQIYLFTKYFHTVPRTE